MRTESASPTAIDSGSLTLGFVLGWFTAIAMYAATAGVVTFFKSDSTMTQSLLLVPWLTLGAMIGGYTWHGKPRTALGLLSAVASIIVIVLLLVGVFFRLLATGQGR